MHRKQIKRAAALALAFVMTASSSGIVSLADELTGEAGQDYVYVTLYAGGGKFVIPAEEPDVPIATPPVASPPVASPPVASPPVASPPVASPPEATPTETDHVKMAVEASPDGNFYLFEDTIDNWLSAEGIELETPDGDDYLSQPIWLTKEHEAGSKLSIPWEGVEISESGMKLYAGWLKETIPASDSDLADAAVTVAGLGKNQTLKVEKLEKAERKGTDDLVKALKNAEEYTNIAAENTLQVDMDVPGYTGNGVSVSIDLPNDFAEKTLDKSIVIIHFGKKTEIITPTYERNYRTGVIQNITFTLKDFSPVIIAVVNRMVDVTLENVVGGYGIVFSSTFGDGIDRQTYLPIGETIKIQEGTNIFLESRELEGAVSNGFVIKEDGVSNKYLEGENYNITAQKTVITPLFEEEGDKTAGRPYADTENNLYGKPAKTSNKLVAILRGSETKVNVSDWAFPEINYGYYDNDLFELSSDGVLTSKEELDYGIYRVLVEFVYEDKTFTNLISIGVGSFVNYQIWLGRVEGDSSKYAYNDVGTSAFLPAGTSFKEFCEADDTWYPELGFFGDKYVFADWYTDAGNRKLVDNSKISGVVSAAAVFKDPDTNMFYTPLIKGFGSTTNKPTHSGSSSSSGGSSSSRLANGNLTGTWQQDGKGWRFKQSDGSYAANKWGKINNLWYYFGADTYMQTGWFFWNNCWYYLNPEKGSTEGVMQVGWQFDKTSQRWFCLSPSGVMLTGWQNVNDKWYYLNPVSDGIQGAMLSNQWIDGRFVNADGVMVK